MLTEELFDNIDFSKQNVVFVDWIDPIKNESFESYARRISADFEKDAVLIGLSFGGMLAVEVSKIIPVKKIILIASAKTKNELPKHYRLAGMLKLNKIIPTSVLKTQNFITHWLFGVQTKSEKELMRNILKDTDPHFLSWAINAVVNWENILTPQNCIHIYGTKDHILPFKNVKTDFIIKKDGHFMTVNRSKEIECIIKEQCT